jgi:hypothetical protein
MVNNYARACLSIQKGKEDEFRPVLCSASQAMVWGDLMQFQARCMMDLINDGTGFLARISRPELGVSILSVVVTNGIPPTGRLHCLDFNAATGDQRRIFMVVEIPHGRNLSSTLHKCGTTLRISDDYDVVWSGLPLQQFDVGGSQCNVCVNLISNVAPMHQHAVAERESSPRTENKRLNALLRRENVVNQHISGGKHSRLLSKRMIFRRRMLQGRKRILVRRRGWRIQTFLLR